MNNSIINIPLKADISIEYAKELTTKINDYLKEDYRASLEVLPKGEPEPIGIGVYKNCKHKSSYYFHENAPAYCPDCDTYPKIGE